MSPQRDAFTLITSVIALLITVLPPTLSAASEKPTDARPSTLDLQATIEQAYERGDRRIVIPPGVHTVTPSGRHHSTHLYFEGMRDVEIDGQGATLVFSDPAKVGLIFKHCVNVTLRGFTIDYDPLPFTQGRITAINPEDGTIDLAIDAGYRTDVAYFSRGLAAYTFDPRTRWIKPGSWDLYPSRLEKLDDATVRVHIRNAASVGRNNAAVGDRMLVSRRAASGMRLIECGDMRVEDLTVWSAAGIAIQEAHGPGGSYYRYAVTRGPAPAGAVEPRLQSANADAFHSAYVHRGPHVEGCRFAHQGDDAIAIHGTYSIIASAGASRQVLLTPKFELPLEVGDTLDIYDPLTYAIKASAKVESIEPSELPEGPQRQAIEELWRHYRSTAASKRYYRVTLDREVDTTVGDLASSPDRNGSGFVIRHNIIRDHRARGLLIKTTHGVIEHNLIEGSSFAGIALGPELAYWLGGDFAQDVVVRHNIVRGTGYQANAHTNPNNLIGAGVVVHAVTVDRRFSPSQLNRRLVIEDNLIEDTASLALLITSARDVVVRDNRIVNPHRLPSAMTGAGFGVDPAAAVFISQASDIVLENNTLVLSESHAVTPLVVGPDVEHLHDQDNGIMVVDDPTSEAAADR